MLGNHVDAAEAHQWLEAWMWWVCIYSGSNYSTPSITLQGLALPHARHSQDTLSNALHIPETDSTPLKAGISWPQHLVGLWSGHHAIHHMPETGSAPFQTFQSLWINRECPSIIYPYHLVCPWSGQVPMPSITIQTFHLEITPHVMVLITPHVAMVNIGTVVIIGTVFW